MAKEAMWLPLSMLPMITEEDLDNAFWNGEYMFYGNGASAFKPLARGLDVGGHEMTHGVVQNTAGLEYQGESGAINESMADCFGV
jgi:bacillolysin